MILLYPSVLMNKEIEVIHRFSLFFLSIKSAIKVLGNTPSPFYTP
jgi:hypothetical protein